MDGKSGFIHAFAMCRRNLGVVGLWPSSNSNWRKQSFEFFFFSVSVCIIVTFITVAQTTKLIMIWGDLNLMTDNISTANLPIAVVVLKMMLFYSRKKDAGELLKKAMDDWQACKTKKETEIMRLNAVTAHKMSMICVFLGFGSVNGQVIVRVSQECNLLAGPEEKRLPMVSSYFPYNYKISPIYEITWIMQYTGAALATLVYSGVYCLFVGLVLHLRGQVSNLRLKFEDSNADDTASGRDFKKKLRLFVQRHQDLNRFAEEIERIFNTMFLAEIISCTVQICSQFFMLVTLLTDVDKDAGLPFLQILFMTIYVMHVGTHVFICCYVSDKLREESLSISKSVYNCRWYNLPAREAKLIILLMRRAEKPLEVTAGKFVAFSLKLYAQILKTSGSYLTMLLAVKERIPSY